MPTQGAPAAPVSSRRPEKQGSATGLWLVALEGKSEASQPQTGRVRYRPQTRRPSQRPELSWHFFQPDECFDVECLREQVKQMHFRDFVATRGPRCILLPSWRTGQNRQVSR